LHALAFCAIFAAVFPWFLLICSIFPIGSVL
jgi:hypothetical protein